MKDILIIISTSIIFIISSYFLVNEKQWTLLPTFWLTSLTAIFSFLAYRHTREKFRLDLYEQRLSFNDDLVIFLSNCLNFQFEPNKKEELANKCIQGLGIHKAKTLFDGDVIDFLNKIHTCYIIVHTQRLTNMYSTDQEKEDYNKHIGFLNDAPNQMQKIFRPYLYFGDHKK